jgi:hypothetical protein
MGGQNTRPGNAAEAAAQAAAGLLEATLSGDLNRADTELLEALAAVAVAMSSVISSVFAGCIETSTVAKTFAGSVGCPLAASQLKLRSTSLRGRAPALSYLFVAGTASNVSGHSKVSGSYQMDSASPLLSFTSTIGSMK